MRNSLLSAMGNLHVSHLLDPKLFAVPTEAPPEVGAAPVQPPSLVQLSVRGEPHAS